MTALWLAATPDLLATACAGAYFAAGCWASFVGADFANRNYRSTVGPAASGASRPAPGAARRAAELTLAEGGQSERGVPQAPLAPPCGRRRRQPATHT